MGKAWDQKYHNGKSSIIKTLDKKFADINIGEKMFIATPKIIDKHIKETPKGSCSNVSQIRQDFAIIHCVDKTCSVITGIFLRIIAKKSFEEYEKSKHWDGNATFRRVIDSRSLLVNKHSFDFKFNQRLRMEEGLAP